MRALPLIIATGDLKINVQGFNPNHWGDSGNMQAHLLKLANQLYASVAEKIGIPQGQIFLFFSSNFLVIDARAQLFFEIGGSFVVTMREDARTALMRTVIETTVVFLEKNPVYVNTVAVSVQGHEPSLQWNRPPKESQIGNIPG